MSMIVRADDDNATRKGAKMAAKLLLHAMDHGKRAGDHIEVTEAIPVGTYKLTHSETPEGHVKLDFHPGKES